MFPSLIRCATPDLLEVYGTWVGQVKEKDVRNRHVLDFPAAIARLALTSSKAKKSRRFRMPRGVPRGRATRRPAEIADNECNTPVSGTQRKTGQLGLRGRDCLSNRSHRLR